MSGAPEAALLRLHKGRPRDAIAPGAGTSEPRASTHVTAAGLCVVAVSAAALAGWSLGEHALTSWVPGAPAVKGNTALALLFGGCSLIWAGRAPDERSREAWLARLLAVVPFAIGALVSAEYVTGRDSGIDQLFWADPWTPASSYPGRPSMFSGLALMLVALPLWLGRGASLSALFHASLSLVALGSWASLAAFLLGVRTVESLPGFRSLSLPATVAFALLAYGGFWLRYETGPMLVVFSKTLAGISARRLLPLGATLPLALAWVRLQGQRLGWYEFEVGLSLFTTSTMLGFIALVWFSTRGLYRLERARDAADASMRRLSERLQLATDAAHLGIWDWDLRTGHVVWDATNHAIFGVAHGEFPETPDAWRALVLPEDLSRVDAEIRAAFRGRSELHTDYRIRRPDGAVRVIEARAMVQRDDAGEAVRLLGTTADVTVEREREARIVASEQLFRNAMEYATIGVALVGLDGRFVKVNRALCELLGYSEPELLELTFREITHPDDVGIDVAQAEKLLAGTLSHYHVEKRYRAKDGHEVRALSSRSLVRGAAGDAVVSLAEIQDVSAQKDAEARLRASLEEKKVLLREIHHRVRNNLQVISSMLRLQSEALDASSKGMFQDSRARIQTMALIHERLYQSGNLATVDFGAHLRELATMLVRLHGVEARGIRLEVSADFIELDLDTAMPLALLCTELITNALKHEPSGMGQAAVVVELSRGADDLTLSVRDDRVGPPEDTSGSLGMRLIRVLAKQLRARISPENGAHHSFTLVVPLHMDPT